MEHEFGWRVGVVEGEGGVWGEGEGFRVEGEDVDAVGVFFDEASEGETVGVRGREGHGVDWVGRFIGDGVLRSQMGVLGGIVHFVWKVIGDCV